MDEHDAGLSEQAATILALIAEGRSYDQILHQHPSLTYFDIFAAAREALDLLQGAVTGAPASEPVAVEVEALAAASKPSFVERARATHGRAWARWTRDEDAHLTALFRRGESRAEMGRKLGRQPGAIERRLLKLGLVTAAEGAGPDAAREIHPWVPEAVEAHDRVGRAPGSPVVPGWEALRDRLTPNRDLP